MSFRRLENDLKKKINSKLNKEINNKQHELPNLVISNWLIISCCIGVPSKEDKVL